MDFILYLNNLILGYFSEESQNDINYIYDNHSKERKRHHNV